MAFWRSSVRVRIALFVSIFLCVLAFALPAWKLIPNSAPGSYLPLHYNVYLGIDQFGPWWTVFSWPLFALGVLFVNADLARRRWQRDDPTWIWLLFLSPVVVGVTLLAILFILSIAV